MRFIMQISVGAEQMKRFNIAMLAVATCFLLGATPSFAQKVVTYNLGASEIPTGGRYTGPLTIQIYGVNILEYTATPTVTTQTTPVSAPPNAPAPVGVPHAASTCKTVECAKSSLQGIQSFVDTVNSAIGLRGLLKSYAAAAAKSLGADPSSPTYTSNLKDITDKIAALRLNVDGTPDTWPASAIDQNLKQVDPVQLPLDCTAKKNPAPASECSALSSTEVALASALKTLQAQKDAYPKTEDLASDRALVDFVASHGPQAFRYSYVVNCSAGSDDITSTSIKLTLADRYSSGSSQSSKDYDFGTVDCYPSISYSYGLVATPIHDDVVTISPQLDSSGSPTGKNVINVGTGSSGKAAVAYQTNGRIFDTGGPWNLGLSIGAVVPTSTSSTQSSVELFGGLL
jgi:hypothetical protein